MKRPVKILLIFSATLVSAWIVGRVTGMFQYYTAATPANEPTIKRGAKFFASNLVKPSRFDFVCYNGYIPFMESVHLSIYRVCGLEGDMVELRNGELYVNYVLADTNFAVMNEYKIANTEIGNFPEELTYEEGYLMSFDNDSSLIKVSSEWVKENSFQRQKFLLDSTFPVAEQFPRSWTADNFGPVKVPLNHLFVLGDNRHNALDSRFRGFVSKDSMVATVLWK